MATPSSTATTTVTPATSAYEATAAAVLTSSFGTVSEVKTEGKGEVKTEGKGEVKTDSKFYANSFVTAAKLMWEASFEVEEVDTHIRGVEPILDLDDLSIETKEWLAGRKNPGYKGEVSLLSLHTKLASRTYRSADADDVEDKIKKWQEFMYHITLIGAKFDWGDHPDPHSYVRMALVDNTTFHGQSSIIDPDTHKPLGAQHLCITFRPTTSPLFEWVKVLRDSMTGDHFDEFAQFDGEDEDSDKDSDEDDDEDDEDAKASSKKRRRE